MAPYRKDGEILPKRRKVFTLKFRAPSIFLFITMEVRKIDKERLGDKVLFPRTQLAGLTCEDKDLMPLYYKDVVRRIHDTRDAAARWWHLYGKG